LCWIHGGPTGQWPVEFNARIAHWVDRGWHVLVPDHRGSTGHGRAYQQALQRRWGELDVEDTAAVLAHAHHSGVGRPTSTVVMGGSSGGSTVLGVVTGPHAALVAGGVAAYPVTELVELAERSHRFEAHYTDTLVAPRDDVDVLRARSMARRAGDLARPLLLLHGTEDPVVPFEGTVAFADAARQAGADVELHVFEGEGHGFADPANQLREYDLIARFLARVVPEPVGA
jgi:dipeptidyl aminopeptidase/acylaminoacyl peptidase